MLEFIALAVNDTEDEALIKSIALVSPAILFGLYWAINRWTQSKWEKGIFPNRLPADNDNLMQAFICLSALMLRADRNDAKEKLRYMHDYFNEHFTEGDELANFTEELRFSMEHPIQIPSVAKWLRYSLSAGQRLQVIYFLTGLSYVDGLLNAREMKILREMQGLLDITEKQFQSTLAMYRQRYERKEEPKPEPSVYRKKSMVALSCQVLGVAESASMDEIKKAYRSLVKVHHPDRFATESEAQQKIAGERFMEIQKAYEILEKYK